MYPLSKEYFVDNLAKYDEYDYIHLSLYRDTHYCSTCYHIAHPTLYKNYLELLPTFEEEIKKLVLFKEERNLQSTLVGKDFWFLDEQYATIKLSDKNIKFIERKPGLRIDRACWRYGNPHDYIDSHSIRPYSQYKTEILKLLQNFISVKDL